MHEFMTNGMNLLQHPLNAAAGIRLSGFFHPSNFR